MIPYDIPMIFGLAPQNNVFKKSNEIPQDYGNTLPKISLKNPMIFPCRISWDTMSDSNVFWSKCGQTQKAKSANPCGARVYEFSFFIPTRCWASYLTDFAS